MITKTAILLAREVSEQRRNAIDDERQHAGPAVGANNKNPASGTLAGFLPGDSTSGYLGACFRALLLSGFVAGFPSFFSAS
jgi:hypothetical protein